MRTATRFARWSGVAAGSLALALQSAAAAPPLRCHPQAQYSCSATGCERTSTDFQHAEFFTWDADTRLLSACLWSRCYSARATLLRSADGQELTAIGALQPEPGAADASPRVVSLTLDRQHNFTAIWHYGAQGLTFDQGRCNTSTR